MALHSNADYKTGKQKVEMSPGTRLYIYTVIASGLAVLAASLPGAHSSNLTQFAFLLLIALAGSSLKVSLPNVTGTMSMFFLFVLIGIVQLSLPETLILASAAVTIQCFWRAKKRPAIVHVLFNVSSSTVATYVAYNTDHWAGWSRIGIGGPLALGIASVVFFVANTAPVAVAIALTESKPANTVWRECYFWCFPYYLLGATVAGLFSILSKAFGWEMAIMTVPVILVLFRSYRLYLDKLQVEKVHAQEMARLHLRTIEALALAIEAKDQTTHKHLERVKVYALEVGKELNLTADELRALEASALLHDIGKLAVPEHIISKPGKLSPEEFEKMKIHPLVGAEILERVEFPYPVAPIVRAHHEKWDGSGYPYGLKGEAIPIGARILAAVDCLDALASDRQYRRALPLDEAMAFVASLSGTSFDPRVVSVLRRRYVELEEMATGGKRAFGLLSTGAKVVRGAAPTAGFENGGVRQIDGESNPKDFLASIAAARQEAQELFELAKDLGNTLSLDETLWVMAARVKRMVPCDAMCIFVLKDRKLVPAFTTGESSQALSLLDVPVGEGLAGWVAENGRPILNGSPSVEPGFLEASDHSMRLNSALAVPLQGLDGVAGVLSLYGVERDAFSRDQLRVLLAISSKIGASIDNAMKYEQARTSATTDFLTSLPNARSLFVHLDGEVARSLREDEDLAVLVCDLDGFKLVNDRFGHLVGNALLRAVATNLRNACRKSDCVARMGGDEFVIVMPGADEETVKNRVLEFDKIAQDTGLRVCGEAMVSLSIGYALLGRDASDAEGLLGEADRRMYREKQTRKATRPIPSVALLAEVATIAIQ